MDDVPPQPTRFNQRTPAIQQRVLFVLSAAATFVVAATLFVSPAPTRSVEAILIWDDSGSNEIVPGLTAEELSSPDFLEQVLLATDPSLPGASFDPLLSELATGLNFERLATTEDGRARLGVQYRGDYPLGASAVNAAAELIREKAYLEPEQLAAKQYEALALLAEDTKAKIAELQSEVEELRNSVEQQAGDALQHELHASTGEPSIEIADTSGSLLRLPSIQDENPRWTALQVELRELERRQVELLNELSPQHPTMRNLSLDVEDRRQQLAATEQYLNTTSPDGSVAIADARVGSGILSPADHRLSELESTLDRARDDFASQQRESEEALKRLAQLRSLDLRLAMPAGLLPPVPGAGGGAILALFLAVAVGVAVAKRAVREDTVFRSVHEAADALPMRIVGVIRSAAPIQPAPLSGPPRSIRIIRLASIGVLTVAVIAMLGRMLSSGQFAEMALKSPIRAMAEAMRGLL